jgi:hypothetical protein
MPCPCRAANGLECLSHSIYKVRPCLIHTCHAAPMPCSDHAVLFKATAQHGRRETACGPPARVRLLPATTRGVPRSLLSEAYHSPSQRSIPTTVKSGSSTLQKRLAVRIFPATTRTFTKDTAMSEQGRGAACYVWIGLNTDTSSSLYLTEAEYVDANLCSCSNCDNIHKHHHRKKKLHISFARLVWRTVEKGNVTTMYDTLAHLI